MATKTKADKISKPTPSDGEVKKKKKVAKTAKTLTGKEAKILKMTVPPEKKKKKKAEDAEVSSAVAVIKQQVVASNKKRISKLNTRGMRSIIGDSAEDIQQLLEVGSNESAITLMQKRMLQAVIDMLPFAEHTIRNTKGQRGVYQFNSLITSMRELMIDMQSTRDKGSLGAEMVERVIRPAFMDIAMVLVQEETRFATDLKEKLSANDAATVRALHRDLIQRLAEGIKEKYTEAKESAISFMQG